MTGKLMQRAVSFIFFVVVALLFSAPPGTCADAGKIKNALLEKARAQLIARLEKTQLQLEALFKQIDAPKWEGKQGQR